MPPPPGDLHPSLRAKLLAAARKAPGGWAIRGQWLAITRFDEPWTTALVHLEGVPREAVYETTQFVSYVKRLHRLLVQSYAWHGLSVPPWRSWGAIARRWGPLGTEGGTATRPPALSVPSRRVHALAPQCEHGDDRAHAITSPITIPRRHSSVHK